MTAEPTSDKQPVKGFDVLWFVSAEHLGTGQPWIATSSDCFYEADRFEITEHGDLSLYKEGVQVAGFPAGGWAKVKADTAPVAVEKVAS